METDLGVGSESCRGLRGAAPVMDRGVRAGCPSLLFSLLRGRDAALHVLPQAEARCHRREGRCVNPSRNLHPRVPSPEGEGQEEGKPGALVPSHIEDCRCYARRGPGRSRRLSLPLGLPPLRERLGLARSAAGRGKMPSTGEAIRHPGQRPLPPSPFSRGRRTGRGDGGGPGRWFGDVQRIDGWYTCRRRGGSRQLSLPLVLPPLRERRGPTRSAAGKGEMPSTRGAMHKPKQKPPPLRPFSRGRRTGRGEGATWSVSGGRTERHPLW